MANLNDDWEEDTEQTEEKEENESDATRFEIMNYPADTTLAGYKDQWDNKQLIIPEFQRKYVWDQVRASKLIESFLLGLPVPGIFLYKERNGTRHLVIDGNQRINTIVSFFKGLFKDKKFILKNVLPEWEGKSFEELSQQDQFKLSTAVMRATIIQQLNPEDHTSIYYIFERLNTGGVNLNPMEVRMCIAEGNFTTLLKELNILPEWRSLIQKPKEDPRLRDVELILRVFALHDQGNMYEKPMKRFLNNYVKDNKNKDVDWIGHKKTIFINGCKKAVLLGGKPFHLKGKLNYAVLDSILISLMDSQISDSNNLKKRYSALIEDQGYGAAITKNTSDKSEISIRLNKAKEIFH